MPLKVVHDARPLVGIFRDVRHKVTVEDLRQPTIGRGQRHYRVPQPADAYARAAAFRELVEANLAEMVRIAGSPERLRPHCKTHKMREVVAMQFSRGLDAATTDRFVTMYVNERTLQYGEEDRQAVQTLLDRGFARGLLPGRVTAEFLDEP